MLVIIRFKESSECKSAGQLHGTVGLSRQREGGPVWVVVSPRFMAAREGELQAGPRRDIS